jgi:4-hydroxy-tetrahydrodipicolinate synthase
MAVWVRRWTAVILLAVVNTFPVGGGWSGEAFAGDAACGGPWSGIYPTVLTPFACQGGVDVVSLEQQIRFELHGGVHGLLVLGTIGEGQYVNLEERAQVVATAVRTAGPHTPVIVGIHTCDLEEARTQLHQAKELGAAAVLVKYIGRPHVCAAEVLGFFAALSDLNLLPIFYYHYPSQTGLRLSAEDIAHILSLPVVIGIKESTLNLREVQAHRRLMCGQEKVFLSGTALNLTQFLDLGGQGAMCPEAVLLPGPTVQAYQAYVHGRHDEARCLQGQLYEMTPILRSRPTPPALTRAMLMSASDHHMPVPMGKDQPQARLKAALNCMGVPTPTLVKCPLPSLTAREEIHVRATVCRLNKIDWCAVAMQAPPVPLHTCPEGVEGGALLKTGSFQLGPNVGRDLLRSQGEGGF